MKSALETEALRQPRKDVVSVIVLVRGSVALEFNSLGARLGKERKDPWLVGWFFFFYRPLKKVDEYPDCSVIINKSLQAYRRGFVRKDSVWLYRNER